VHLPRDARQCPRERAGGGWTLPEEAGGARVGLELAGREGQQAGVAAQIRQPGQLLGVLVAIHVAVEVALPEVEEEPLDEEIDQLVEQARLEHVVTAHQLERAEDVVLLLADPQQEPIVCVHDALVHRRARDLLLVRFDPGRSAPGYDRRTRQGGQMAVSAYILIQTEVGKAAQVAVEVDGIEGVVSAEDVTGPYDVIARAEASTVDELGKMVVSRVQMIDGITRTLTCPVVHL
jgi:DNA-binding Lrp family transcriptional regulator